MTTETPVQPAVAALFVQADGCYSGRSDVDTWPETRDARLYSGPWPVVAHPPCQRWGRFWHGSTRKPHQFRRGEDTGCFAAALTAVRNYGGVLEHPAGSSAWEYFGLRKPSGGSGWIEADAFGGWTCQIDQKHYGHQAPKPTWLYAVRTDRPELDWTKSDRTPPQWMIDRYGESKARHIGQVAMIGGKDKTKIRNATPPVFRDLLLSIARSVNIHGPAGGMAFPVGRVNQPSKLNEAVEPLGRGLPYAPEKAAARQSKQPRAWSTLSNLPPAGNYLPAAGEA